MSKDFDVYRASFFFQGVGFRFEVEVYDEAIR